MLQVRQVTKHYHDQVAVDELSLEVAPGEIVGILGPNGAGKTTLLRMIMGILEPDSGEIILGGKALTRPSPIPVGYLPEERGLYLKQKVLEVLIYLGQLKGLAREEAETESRDFLNKLNLGDHEKSLVESLSKGMQQKVQLIAALLSDPAMVILDEPFTGFDPTNIRLVKDTITQLAASEKAILLSTHQMNLVEELCHRVYLIHRGKLIVTDEVRALRQKHSEDAVLVEGDVTWSDMDEVESSESWGDGYKLVLKGDVAKKDFLQAALGRGEVTSYQLFHTPLEEIFIRLTGEENPS